MKLHPWIPVLVLIGIICHTVRSQTGIDSVKRVSRRSTLTFMVQNGTCIYGTPLGIDNTQITVQQDGKPSITIKRADLLQISQGDALLFTVFNSWLNVENAAAHVYPGEAFVLKLRDGRLIKGRPSRITPDLLSLKHGFLTTVYKRDDVATIDYLRFKPESDAFDYVSQEAPALLFLDPEFYYRVVGLEGRIPVRLYDSDKPMTFQAPQCIPQ